MKIVVVPIDDRPCHTTLVQSALEGYQAIEALYPSKNILGHFMKSGDTKSISNFIEKATVDADALVVSIDALLFGGLVQARTSESEIDFDAYRDLLQSIHKAKKQNSTLKIYAYSVIMRLTTTVTDSNNLEIWELIFKYSQLVHKAELDSKYEEVLRQLETQIPKETLRSYLNARKRNHWANKEVIKLVFDDIIDYAVLVQEDTTSYGMHVKEQEVLKGDIAKYKLNDRVIIKNGTDEMVALLIARLINATPSIVSVDDSMVDPEFIAMYEDRPVLENFKRSLDIANLKEGQSNTLVFITPTKGKPVDLCFESPKLLEANSDVVPHLKSRSFSQLGILDVRDANGGNVELLESILSNIDKESLIAYSAWNTASNAMGTFLLDITLALKGHVNRKYLRHRILDDALYQGSVRSILNQWMKEKGYDVWKENEDTLLNETVTRLMNDAILKHNMIVDKTPIKAHLPWGRSFEIEMEDI